MDGWMDGWKDGWMDWNWNWKTLFTHGNFIKIYIYGNIYIISVLPKSRASDLFTSIITTHIR